MYNAFDNEFTDCFHQTRERTNAPNFCLIVAFTVSFIFRFVEAGVPSFVPCLVERCELTVLDEGANIMVTDEMMEFLVVISLITDQYLDELRVAFHPLWRYLRVVSSRRGHVSIENRLACRVDQ